MLTFLLLIVAFIAICYAIMGVGIGQRALHRTVSNRMPSSSFGSILTVFGYFAAFGFLIWLLS